MTKTQRDKELKELHEDIQTFYRVIAEHDDINPRFTVECLVTIFRVLMCILTHLRAMNRGE